MSSAAAASLSYSILALLRDPPYSLKEVQQQHAHMVKTGLMRSTFVASRLLHAAGKASATAAALPYCRSIFDRIPEPNSFTWNAMFLAYAESSNPQLALLLFMDMLVEDSSGVLPDRFTFPLVLKVCAALGAAEEARQVHARVVKTRFCWDIFVLNTLLHAYVSSGREAEATTLFDRMPDKDVVSYNVLISQYATRGQMGKARVLFDTMPTTVKRTATWNYMVSGYVNVGLLHEARAVFDEMPDRDVVSWNAMIAGYAHGDRFSDVFAIFSEMLLVPGVKPDARTLVIVLSACAHLGALGQGEWVHAYMERNGLEAEDGFLCAALVDMYSKCGDINNAVEVFEGACGGRRPKDVSAWNCMIGGLGSHGRGLEALELFDEMAASGVEPNEITFVSVLAACSQGGLVEQGKRIFNELLASGSIHGIKPTVLHYGCMVDMLARVGELEEAVRIITTSSSVPNVEDGAEGQEAASVLWESLLSSCRRHGDVELAELVAHKLAAGTSRLERSSYPLVQLSNIYASVGRWDDVDAVRAVMRGRAVTKEPGGSSIEVDGVVHEFFPGDRHT